jgi:hypothetical protein
MSDVGYETPISEIDDDQMMPHDENITFDVSPTYVKYATITGAHLIHDKYCAEDGRCKRQKGLVEGLPKGFYCCKEIALTYNRTKFMKFTEDGKILVLNSNDATLGELDDESQDAVMAAIDGINKGMYRYYCIPQ